MKMKNFADTYLYSLRDANGYDIERDLIEFVTTANPIDKSSSAFKQIQNEVKVRQTTAVLYRILSMPDVFLLIGNKEMGPSFKVIRAKYKKMNYKPAILIDCTGLITLKNGMFYCKEIDKLCAYLMDALFLKLYYENPNKLLSNATVMKSTTISFTKLFTLVLDNLRLIGFTENRDKITYITAVYFLYCLAQKDLSRAKQMATSVIGLDHKTAQAWDFYYTEDNLKNINEYVTFLADVFKLKGLDTTGFLYRWQHLLYEGTLYATELFPSFLNMLGHAYSGVYLNNVKMIENICGKDMVNAVAESLRIGASVYDKGFKYESGMIENIRDRLDKQ